MTQTIDPTTTIARHERLISSANAELAVMAREQPALQAREAAIDAELAMLEAREQARVSRLESARQTRQQALTTRDQAATHARLQAGTREQAEAEDEHQKAVAHAHRVEKDVAALEAQAAEEEQEESKRVQLISSERQECVSRLSFISGERQRLLQEKEAATLRIGESVYRQIQVDLEGIDRQLAEDEERLRLGKEVRATHVKQGIERLANWPGLQSKLQAEVPRPDNGLDQVLSAAHDYIQCLLREHANLPQQLPYPSVARWGTRWRVVLALSAEHFNNRDRLMSQLDAIELLRREHRQEANRRDGGSSQGRYWWNGIEYKRG